MTLVHPAEDISLGPALRREVHTAPHTHCLPVHPQVGAIGTTLTCLECKHLCSSVDSFKKHMQLAHPKPQVPCKICEKVYKTVKSLRRHEKKMHSDQIEAKLKGDLPCTHCPRKFSTQTALYWHEVRNHMEMLKTSTCQVCGKQLSDHASLKRHLEMIHSLETASCGICNKTFKSFTNLQRHVNVTHAPEDAVQTCNICNKDFKCSMHLRIHIRTVHAAEDVFSCDVCSKEFLSKKYLLKHKKTHVDVKEFACGICNKLFKSSDDVRKHIRRVHMKATRVKPDPRSVTCDICNKEFSLRKYMLLHKKTHINIRTFSCEHCDKLFKFASHVRKHTKRVHMKTLIDTTGIDGMFTCDICKKSFTVKKNMAKHIKIHYGRRDTPCGICDKLFKCNSDVNRHLKRVHMKGLQKKDTDETDTTNMAKTQTKHTTSEYIEDALENVEYTENVFASSKYTVKALEISEYTDQIPRSEDYRLETLGSAEYTLNMLSNTSHTEEPERTDFVKETLVKTKYTKETTAKPLKTEFTQDDPESSGITDLGNSDVIKDAIKISEITMNDLEDTDKGIDNSSRLKVESTGRIEFKEMNIGNTVITGKALRNTDIIKNAIDISDFTTEDLVVADDLGRTKIKEEKRDSNTNIIRDALNKSDFIIEYLDIKKARVKSTASETEAFTVDTFGSIRYAKEASENYVFTDKTAGAKLIKNALRNTDIIREAIEISDFTMEDLGITDYTENVMGNTESLNNAAMIVQTIVCTKEAETYANSGFKRTLGGTKDENVIAEIPEFADKVRGSKDIIKEALNISDFTIEDLDITEEVGAEKAKDFNSNITDGALVTNFMETLYYPMRRKQASEAQIEVLENTEFEEKVSDTADTIKSAIESSEFAMEDFELTEYTETEYAMDDLGLEECHAEVIPSTEFIDEDKSSDNIELADVLRTELTDTDGNIYSIEEALGKPELDKDSATDFLEEAFNETVYADNGSESRRMPQEDATEFIDKAFGNTDIIKEAIDNSEFTMADLGITDYSDVLSTDYTIDALGMADTLTNMNLLNCLKCGVDFKNDVDLHTHLCGGEMTLFLDFQDM